MLREILLPLVRAVAVDRRPGGRRRAADELHQTVLEIFGPAQIAAGAVEIGWILGEIVSGEDEVEVDALEELVHLLQLPTRVDGVQVPRFRANDRAVARLHRRL